MSRTTFPCIFALALFALPAGTARADLFDFTGLSDGLGFNGQVDQLSTSGLYTFTGSGFLQENTDVIFMFQDDGGIINGDPNPIASTSQILDLADVPQTFTVNSVDWRALGANGGNTAALIGYSGGVGGTEQWRINGPQDIDPPTTFVSPTTGSFGNSIDTLYWDIPDYADGTFGQTLDNLDFNIGSTPPPGSNEVFEFSTISDGAGFNGAIDAPSNSGNYTFATSAPSIVQEDASTIFMFESGGTGGQKTAELQVLDLSDTAQAFTVNSLDWRALDGLTTGATLTGYSGGSSGTQQWQLSGDFPLDPPANQASPTTGSFSAPIDTIVWDIQNYVDNTFGNTLDNLDINIGSGPPPPTGTVLTYDFEDPNSLTDPPFYNGPLAQTLEGYTLNLSVGNFCDRVPGTGDCSAGGVGSNRFVFGQINDPVNEPLNVGMTLDDPNGNQTSFKLVSIDFANNIDVTTSIEGVQSFVTQFDVAVPSVTVGGDSFEVTQSLDENGLPLSDHEVGFVQISYLNDTGGFKFPAIDNIVIELLVDLGLGSAPDWNEDGIVDGLDFLIWQRGDSPEGGTAEELALWQANYGNPPPVSATNQTVPEPTTAVLLISLGLAITPCRRRESLA